MFCDSEKYFLPPGLFLVQAKSEFDAGQVVCTEVHIQVPTEWDTLHLITLPATKKEIIFQPSISQIYPKELIYIICIII